MSKHDNMADLHAELRDVIRRLRDLETANPLNHASIQSDGIRVLTPGGEGGATGGDEVVLIGHAQGKSGFLIKEGGEWVSAGEKIALHDTEIASAKGRLDFTGNRLDDAEGRIGGLEPRMAETEIVAWAAKSAADDHETRIVTMKAGVDNMWPRLAAVETGKASVGSVEDVSAVAWAAKNAADNHAPRIANVEQNKASQTSLNTLQSDVGLVSQSLTNLRNYVYSIHGSPQG